MCVPVLLGLAALNQHTHTHTTPCQRALPEKYCHIAHTFNRMPFIHLLIIIYIFFFSSASGLWCRTKTCTQNTQTQLRVLSGAHTHTEFLFGIFCCVPLLSVCHHGLMYRTLSRSLSLSLCHSFDFGLVCNRAYSCARAQAKRKRHTDTVRPFYVAREWRQPGLARPQHWRARGKMTQNQPTTKNIWFFLSAWFCF